MGKKFESLNRSDLPCSVKAYSFLVFLLYFSYELVCFDVLAEGKNATMEAMFT